MNRGAIHRPADLMVLIVCLCATAIAVGMDVAKAAPPAECQPGFVTSVRWPDGRLDCHHERTDWRRPVEKRRAK